MIILDLNGVMFTNVILSPEKIDQNLIRHMTLNCIRSYLMKFRREYGDLVIASDNVGSYWRRDAFPYYKASRRKGREDSKLDWKAIFSCMKIMREELTEHFPYPLIDVPGAEADDVIATLVHHANYGDKILILSPDQDFVQLQTKPNLKQYDPVRKKWVHTNNPETYLIEHIIRGDAGDGVPNILTADDFLATRVVGDKSRQRTISSKKLEEIVTRISTGNLGEHQRNYDRNKMLIDLTQIPRDVQDRVLESYKSQQGKPRHKIFNFMIANRMKYLIESVNEF